MGSGLRKTTRVAFFSGVFTLALILQDIPGKSVPKISSVRTASLPVVDGKLTFCNRRQHGKTSFFPTVSKSHSCCCCEKDFWQSNLDTNECSWGGGGFLARVQCRGLRGVRRRCSAAARAAENVNLGSDGHDSAQAVATRTMASCMYRTTNWWRIGPDTTSNKVPQKVSLSMELSANSHSWETCIHTFRAQATIETLGIYAQICTLKSVILGLKTSGVLASNQRIYSTHCISFSWRFLKFQSMGFQTHGCRCCSACFILPEALWCRSRI